ncbi:hypothetical protein N7520_008340 [Penicillium odoratum]|uniref:uncharacterized protein n=1 Tax=Penicillium odoratum TaxID=1167516 RepID=UPI002548C974|nr:uncharacterized protein N7520_008340 [Penicillium odoratum]KAJ5761184.1 hypothetical protein N7520_008340 [Penicillium odoratum]
MCVGMRLTVLWRGYEDTVMHTWAHQQMKELSSVSFFAASMIVPDMGLIRDQVGELAHQKLACQDSQLLTASWAHNSLGVHQIPKTRTLAKETPHVPLAQSTYDAAQYV